METEQKLYQFIKELHQEIIDMTPNDGLSSPRDIALVTNINKKSAILNKLQEAMRIINPKFNYQP